MPLGDSWLARGTLPGSLFWWRTGLLPAAPWGSSGAALFLDEEDIEAAAAAARKQGTREVAAVAVVGLAGKSCTTTSCQPIIRNPQVSPPLSLSIT